METVTSMFWNYKAKRLHVFVELSYYPVDTYENSLDGFEVHSTKLLRNIWIISVYELLDEFLHISLLVFLWVSEDVLKDKILYVS